MKLTIEFANWLDLLDFVNKNASERVNMTLPSDAPAPAKPTKPAKPTQPAEPTQPELPMGLPPATLTLKDFQSLAATLTLKALQSLAVSKTTGQPDKVQAVKDILAEFGVKKLADLKPTSYEAVASLFEAL